MTQVQSVWHANWQVYGADKVWMQMIREGIAVARYAVERLMRCLGLRGVKRGKVVRTTVPDMSAPRPLDRVNRQFKALRPNQLWVSDFKYVCTWQGWLYVALVIDVFARRIVGWRVSSSMRRDFVLDALEHTLYDRQPGQQDALIHHASPANHPSTRNTAVGRQGFAGDGWGSAGLAGLGYDGPASARLSRRSACSLVKLVHKGREDCASVWL